MTNEGRIIGDVFTLFLIQICYFIYFVLKAQALESYLQTGIEIITTKIILK